jgi:type VI secretion system secreted protein Hcp
MATTATSPTPGASFDSYLQIDGVPGESLNDKHKDWIELVSYSHKMTQPVSATRSSAGGASSGRSQHGDFVIVKYVDKASPKLYEAVSNGKAFAKAKIEVCRAGGSQVKFMEITLEEVIVSHVELNPITGATANSSGDILPTETVHLNYGKIEWVYTQQKRKDGSGGGNVTGKYDLTAGKS